MMAPRFLPTKSTAGFTLVELVIVMAIIGLVAAISLPRIDIARYQAETAMQGVGTTLRPHIGAATSDHWNADPLQRGRKATFFWGDGKP